MNLQQAVKMAWKSIWGKKGRSALTILGIFIGIAAVMTIVSVMEGMKQKTMEQFDAMGSNRITVRIYSWVYDENGNDLSKDYFPELYDYCAGLSEYVVGVHPRGGSVPQLCTARSPARIWSTAGMRTETSRAICPPLCTTEVISTVCAIT